MIYMSVSIKKYFTYKIHMWDSQEKERERANETYYLSRGKRLHISSSVLPYFILKLDHRQYDTVGMKPLGGTMIV